MLIDLGLIWVIGWMLKTAVEDVTHAVKGTTNPRYELKKAKAKAKAAGQAPPRQPRYGGREWFADLLSDGLEAQTQRRRAKAKDKAQPVDDMVGVVSEPAAPARTRRGLCPVCLITELPAEGGPCPTCTFWKEVDEANERREAEWKAGMRPTGDYERPPCVQCRAVDAQPGSVRCPGCDRRAEAEADREDDELNADDVLDTLAAAGGVRPECSWHNTPMRQVDGRLVCPACTVPPQPAATDDRPDARIYQFPNVKTIEKEITMSNPEATGLPTAIAFAEAAAQAHASFSTAGSEGYAGALERMGFGEGITALAGQAREQSTIAADKWKELAEAMNQFQGGREFYANNPDAPEKVALVNE
ncbi:hypothetical protein ACGFIG_09220 [Micromonospora sp. NPDC049048]|uniref:hypothetical protein n=1 Tax=Micromonospora sp. NPDC049048 TaxID=3364263 RepID=UPI0037188D8F